MKRSLLLLLLVPTSAFGDPSISGTAGAWRHGATDVVISGSGFGTKEPAAPHFWEDFEAQEDENTVTSTDPPIGSWCESTTSWQYQDSYNSVAHAHPRSTRYLMGHHTSDIGGQSRNNIELGIVPGDEAPENIVVLMYYLRLDPAWGNPPAGVCSAVDADCTSVGEPYGCCTGANVGWCDTSTGIDRNYKEMWFQEKDRSLEWSCSTELTTNYTGNDESYSSTEPWHYNAIGDASAACGESINNVTFGGNPSQRWNKRIWVLRDSECFVELGNLSDYDGGDASYITRSSSGNLFGGSSGDHDDIWMVNFGSYARYCGGNNYAFKNMRRYIDDVYLDYTFSRVVLGDAATGYGDCTVLEPQIPSAWSPSSITVQVHLGGLTGGRAYLYVFDADNNVNAAGYEVTLGQSDSPAAPEDLTLTVP